MCGFLVPEGVFTRTGEASSKVRVVLDVVHPVDHGRSGRSSQHGGVAWSPRRKQRGYGQETGGVEHSDNLFYNVEVVLGDVHPDIERCGEGGSELFAGDRREVSVRLDQGLPEQVDCQLQRSLCGCRGPSSALWSGEGENEEPAMMGSQDRGMGGGGRGGNTSQSASDGPAPGRRSSLAGPRPFRESCCTTRATSCAL